MKWWKRIALSLAVVILGLSSFLAYRAIARHRDLQETFLWMDQTYNPHEGGGNLGQGHGWEIHYVRKNNMTEEVTQKFNTTFTHDGRCNMTIRSETFPVGIFSEVSSITVYELNLCDIDPASIKMKTYDLHKDVFNCADSNEVKSYELSCDNAEIEFMTRNGATAINEETVTTFWKLAGKDHESRSVSKTNKYWLIADDVPYAQRLAKALEHAVELCGGKVSRF
jgi:hypothetical protein